MHPEIVRAEPGLCPLCGMSLVPQEATPEDHKKIKREATAPTTVPTKHQHQETALTSEPTSEEKIAYTCPMHPRVREDHPGNCPICEMKLVPLKPSARTLPPSQAEGFASVEISPEQQWLIGVKTTSVVKESLHRRLRTVGTVAFDAKLYVAQKEYLEVLKTSRASGTKSLLTAAQRKLMLLGMTESQIETLQTEKKVDDSLFLTKGTGKAWIYSTIYESERSLLREGLRVEIQTVGHPKKTYLGKIDAIIPVVNPTNRTITVRTKVEDPIGLLKPDMFVDVSIEIPLGQALSVPKSAILRTGKRNIAMVARGNGIFEPREVVLGNQSDNKHQIISGLQENEVVVTSANFLIDSESQLQGAFSTNKDDSGGHQHGP